MEILIVGALGLAVGEIMRRRLNRLGYRLCPGEMALATGDGNETSITSGDGDGTTRTSGDGDGMVCIPEDVDETLLPVPGVRWWIPVVLGVGWACVAWRYPISFQQTWSDVTAWARLLGWLGFAGIGLGMAVIDLDVRRLPDRGQILLALVSVVFGVVICWEDPIRLAVGLASGLACGLVFLIMHAISRGSLGLGDVKLVMTCGWWLGLTSVASVFAGLLTSCVLAVAYSLLSKQRQFAFGPWLVAGTLTAGLWVG